MSSATKPAISSAPAPRLSRRKVPRRRSPCHPAAKADVDAHGALPVPAHLRNAATPLGKSLGWGAGYQYPHDFEGHYVREEYLPEPLRGHRYYKPSDSGLERELAARLATLTRKK